MTKHQQNSQRTSASPALTFLVLSLVIGLGGCASTKDKSVDISKDDPYENINRKIYGFNDKVDDYVAKPVTDAYKFVTPDFMETGVSNFFNNLKTINVVLNDVLQGKFEQGGRDTGRFLMNSTLGLAGVFDVAKSAGLDQNDEDFEQTLAVWGVPQGSYIVLPLLGPITTRGIPGAVFDSAANPTTYIGPFVPIQALSLVNARANAEGSLKFIDEAALDPYVFTRESFLQWRNHLATDGKGGASADTTDLDVDLLEDTQSSGNKTSVGNGGGEVGKNNGPAASSSSSNKTNAPSSNQNDKVKLDLVPPDANDLNVPSAAGKNISTTKKDVVAPSRN
jgi:phospholipid-binding lipoprotein MlaA